MSTKKKKTRRSKVKNASLKKRYTSRVRREYVDYDYLDELTEEEKEFLNDFTAEYYEGKVGRQKDEGKNNRFTKGKDEVKKSQDANNARNRCLLSGHKAQNKMINADYYDLQSIIDEYDQPNINTSEDALIELIDNFNDTGDYTDDDTD